MMLRDVAHTGRAAFKPAASRAHRRRATSRRPAVQCHSLLELFKGLTLGRQDGNDGKQWVERPVYKPSEMIEVAPGVRISPMGLGTW